MPPSTIRSTTNAISSPDRRYGSSEPKRQRDGWTRRRLENLIGLAPFPSYAGCRDKASEGNAMSTKSKKPGSNLDPHSIFDAELQRIPAKMRKFLAREPTPSTFEKTWEYFEGAFGMAFDMLTQSALANWSGGAALAASAAPQAAVRRCRGKCHSRCPRRRGCGPCLRTWRFQCGK
jgi:hypothetical protein